MKILILEDNHFDADLAKRAILNKINDCEIYLATSLADTKQLLDVKFDIAILDLKLPDGYGIDILSDLVESNNQISVIMLTGSGDEEFAVTALKYGADDYILKRGEYLEQLSNTINSLIEKKKLDEDYTKKLIRVLYVEHHSSDVELTLFHFKRFAPNFKFQIVNSYQEALKELSNKITNNYNIILLDYKLPGVNALELTKEIRSVLKLDLPIVFVTGQGNEEIAVKALKFGVDEYLVKNKNYLYRLPSLLLSAHQKYLLKKQFLELQESEELFRGIFDNHSAIKLIINPENGQIFSANNAAAIFYGWSINELKKMTLFDINTLPKDKIIVLMDKLKKLKGGHFEFSQKLANGTIKDVSVFSSIVVINGKEYLHSIVYDISKRKRAEKQLKLLNASVEQSPISILITDTNGTIEYVNPFFCELTGYKYKELIGRNPRILNSGNQTNEYYKNMWDTILAGKNWQGEICNKKKDGKLFWENILIAPIKNEFGTITHFVGVKEDITKKKKMIDQLIKTKEKAVESERLKSAFLANMSHEIRTPMNGILGFAELLKQPHLSDEKQQKYIRIIEKSGNRMLNIIHDIIDISKIESGIVDISLSEMNINEQLEYVYNFFKPEALKKGLEFLYSPTLPAAEAIVNTDQTKFLSIITNLVKNAIKFTDKGSITIGYNKKGGLFEFYVKDTGIGIAQNKQKAIFERFIQEDIEDKMARQGAGLGLSIAKAYTELLGGKIWLTSEKGVGSTFYFSINKNDTLTTKNESKSVDADELELHLKPLEILIVEDDETSAFLIETLLRKLNSKITIVNNGADAVEQCKTKANFDLILMDVKMPVMDGLEATRSIRQFNKEVVIIAQTAHSLAGDSEKALKAGCNGYLSKPIVKSDFFSLINQFYSQ